MTLFEIIMAWVVNIFDNQVIVGGAKGTHEVNASKSAVALWGAITLKQGLPYKTANHFVDLIQVLNHTSSKILMTVYRSKGENCFRVYFNLMGRSKNNFNPTKCPKGKAIQKALKAARIVPYNGLENDGKGYYITLPLRPAPDVKATFNIESITALNNWALKNGTTSRQAAIKCKHGQLIISPVKG